MLCRYEQKAIVSPVKDKTKAKPKGKVAPGAKGANVPARPAKSARPAEKAEETTQAAGEPNEEGSEPEEGDDEIVEAAGEVVEEEVKVDDIPKPSATRGGGLARLDPMQQYLREVQRHSLPTPQEEHDLAVKYVGSGDVAGGGRLVTANLKSGRSRSSPDDQRAYKNIMDLVQEGNIGLMQAVKSATIPIAA
jgi:RNA polymerase sigma-32 factor